MSITAHAAARVGAEATASHVAAPPFVSLGAHALRRGHGLERVAARLAERIVELPVGRWDPATELNGPGDACAAMVIDGLVMREVLIQGVPAAQLVIPSDTVDICAETTESPLCGERIAWHVLEPTTIAILGRRFLAAAQRQPAVFVAFQRGQTAQMRRAARYAAITHLRNGEQRLLALFCALAEERGRVGRDGIAVTLDVTHEQLGRLVGARRPTVSLALKCLHDDGLLVRHRDAWVIARHATPLAPDPFPKASATGALAAVASAAPLAVV